jgi:uncharacterized protein (DUF1015 family)
VVEDGGLGRPRGACVVVRRDRVEELRANVRLERGGARLDEAQTEVDVPEEPSLHGRLEHRGPPELLRPPDVVQERRREQEITPQPPVELRRVAAERGDGNRVLEEPPRVSMMALGRRGERAEARPHFGVADEAPDERSQAGVGELGGEELEEAVELVEVAPRLGHERGRIRLRRLELAHLELESVAEALDAAEDAHRVAFAEAAVEELDVAPDARLDAAARIHELEGEVRSPRPGGQALLPRDREDAVDHAVLRELGNRRRDRHAPSLGAPTDGSAAVARLARVALLKPFRALRYDVERSGPLDRLVAPPHDVITPEERDQLAASSRYNVVRLIRPDHPDEAGDVFRDWNDRGILVREAEPAAWLLEEEFLGPDGVARARRGLVARVRLKPYTRGVVLPHERTSTRAKQARLELLRAVRTKLSPILLLHDGAPPALPERSPDLEVSFHGVRSRLWRVTDASAIGVAFDRIRTPFVIADGHHRYETALRFHEEEGTAESAHVLAALVSRDDDGLVVFPTHRVAGGAAPELNGRFRVTPLNVSGEEAVDRLAAVPRDRAAFVMLRGSGAVLAEAAAVATATRAVADTTAVDSLPLENVRFTPSVTEAESAVASGAASAAFLVRAPSVDEVEAVARAGETMPRKSTYFFPKLTSGLLFSPLDE